MKKIGIVSTFNVECGIATYSEHLTEFFPEGSTTIFAEELGSLSDTKSSERHPIIRCWSRTGTFEKLTEEVLRSGVDVVHFQHEFGLFQNNESFLQMLSVLKGRRIGAFSTFHTIFDTDTYPGESNKKIIDISRKSHLIIAHGENGKDHLKANNCIVIPHGSVVRPLIDQKFARAKLNIPQDKFVILIMGFITPTKGSIDSATVVMNLRKRYPDIHLCIVGMPMVHGSNFKNLEYCLNLYKHIKRMNGFGDCRVYMKFASESDLDLFAGAADMAIENYYQTNYSTSGMSHLVMSYGLPSVSSRANILADLDHTRSWKFDIGDWFEMERGIDNIYRDINLRRFYSKNCLDYTDEVSWPKIAEKHLETYERHTA